MFFNNIIAHFHCTKNTLNKTKNKQISSLYRCNTNRVKDAAYSVDI